MARQLVIELVGKADKYTKTLNDAGTATDTWGSKVEGAGKKMTAFVSVPIIGFLGASTKAAMDDAAAQDHLATTLGNTIGNSQQLVKDVEAYITSAQKASTFTDDELRPAFELFATTTKSVEDSQRLTNIAMDVAAGKGIALETAAKAVAKAHEGQFEAANKLVPGLVDVSDKTLTVDQVTSQLAETFNGQAIAATETTAGKMQNLKRDLGEASEAMGAKLLPAVTKFADFATNTLLPALDSISGGNGAFVALGLAAAGPVLTQIANLKKAIVALNLSLDATAVKAATALGAVGIVVGGVQTVIDEAKEAGGSNWNKAVHGLLGNSAVSDFLGGGRAAGGPVTAGRAYLVGERGPEMWVPGRSGTVIPNGAMGGVTVNVYGSVMTERDLGRTVADALGNNGLYGVG